MSIFPGTVAQLKELAVTGRPLLIAQFLMFDNVTNLYVSSHPLNTLEGGWPFGGNSYTALLVSQNIPGLQMRSTTGIDQIASVTLGIADPGRDLYTSIEQVQGFKGALLTIVLIFAAGVSNNYSSDYWIKFQGVCSKPQFAADGTITIVATATKNLSKTFTPSVRFQNRCPWTFPATLAQRQAAAFDQSSIYFNCGYCPDVTGVDPIWGDSVTRGNLISGIAATVCDYTATGPQGCQTNGMYVKDSSNRYTGSFGGEQWGPTQLAYTSKSYATGKNVIAISIGPTATTGLYNSPVPEAYGTCWVDGVPVNTFNDGNSSRSEVVFSLGQVGIPGDTMNVQGVQGVVANGVWVPYVQDSPDQTIYRWGAANRGSITAIGTRRGIPTSDTGFYNSQGDPYGSLAMIEVVVYVQIGSGNVRVLTGGQLLMAYQPIATAVGSGSSVTVTFPSGVANNYVAGNPPYTVQIVGNTWSALNQNWQLSNFTYGPPGTITLASSALTGSGTGGAIMYRTRGIPDASGVNPAWLVMNRLIWGNYQYTDVDLTSFANEAAWCAFQIAYTDITGAANTHSRFKMSCAFEQRRPSDQVVLALLNACNGQIRTDIATGLRQFFIRKGLGDQQPAPNVDATGHNTSNYNTALKSTAFDGSLTSGYPAYWFNESTLSGPPVELPRDSSTVSNCLSFSFQDEENSWSQDSLSVTDDDDVARVGGYGAGNVVNENWTVEGICNYDQGTRVARVKLAEDIHGNELQDVRGTRMWTLSTNYRVAHLRSGDICLLSWEQLGFTPAVPLETAASAPVPGILVRVLSVQDIAPNFEKASVTVRWHEDIWYTDAYGQNPAPVYTNAPTPNRPPYAWNSLSNQRTADDSLFPSGAFFDFAVNYVDAADGSTVPVASIYGSPVVNKFSNIQPPLVPLAGTATSTGGALQGGTIFYAVTAVDSSGNETSLSRFCIVTTTAGVTAGTNSIPVRAYDPGTVSFNLYGGTSELLMGRIFGGLLPSALVSGSILYTALSTSLHDFRGKLIPVVVQYGFRPNGNPPDPVFDHFHVRGKKVALSGVWGGPVTAAGGGGSSPATLSVSGMNSPDNWVGYIVSKLGINAQGPNAQPNFAITAQAGAILTLSEAHGEAPSYTVGDQVAIRAMGNIVTSNSIGDPMFVNSSRPGGITFNFAGYHVRIVAGTGAGQEYPIVSNTTTTFTINGTWTTTPDTTSVFIVVEASFLYDSVGPSVTNTTATAATSGGIPIGSITLENTAGLTVLVEVLTEDVNGNSMPEYYAPWREVYIVGQAGTSVSAQTVPPFGPDGGTAVPVYGDPFYPFAMFGLATSSQAKADGSVLSGALVSPGVPVSVFSSLIPAPVLGTYPTPSSSGGNIAGSQTVFFALAGIDASGNYTALSNIVFATLSSGSTWSVPLSIMNYASAMAQFVIFAGLRVNDSLAGPSGLLYSIQTVSAAASLTVTTITTVTGQSMGMPDANFNNFVLGTTKILLLASIGTAAAPLSISSVNALSGTSYQLGISGATLTASALIGRVLTWLQFGTSTTVPLQDLEITANDASSITVSAPTPPSGWLGPAARFVIGDLVCVSLQPTLSGGGVTVTDSLLSMVTNQYQGSVLRLFYPDGSNQTSFIVSNTADSFTVQAVDNFSGLNPTRFWIEPGTFSSTVPVSPSQLSAYVSGGLNASLFVEFDNITRFNAVQTFSSDVNGNLSPAGVSPILPLYYPGQPGSGGSGVVVPTHP